MVIMTSLTSGLTDAYSGWYCDVREREVNFTSVLQKRGIRPGRAVFLCARRWPLMKPVVTPWLSRMIGTDDKMKTGREPFRKDSRPVKLC